jgi:NitT/TauT family transport system substrate-binding protein
MNRRQMLGGVAGTAAFGFATRVARAAETPLQIAMLPVDPAAGAYYAQDLGYFRDAGLRPSLQVIQAGSAVVAAVLSNAIDIGWSNPISVAAARLRGLPLVCIAAGGVYVDGQVTAGIVVPNASPAKTAKDLNGKTIGISGLKTLGEWSSAAWIDKNGGDSRSIHWVEMPFPEMPTALAQNRVDAAYAAEPFITLSKDSARVFADAFGAIAPRFMIGSWITTQSWADAHKDVVAHFAQAMARASLWANDHHDQSALILAKYSKLDPAVTKTMARVAYGTRPVAAEIQPVLDVAFRYGALSAQVNADDLIYKA